MTRLRNYRAARAGAGRRFALIENGRFPSSGIDMAAHRLTWWEARPPAAEIFTIDITDPSRIAMLGSLQGG